MSDVIEIKPSAKKEFYVFADDAGIGEVRVSNDVIFATQVYLGIGNFLCGGLRNNKTGEQLGLPQFLRDLADMVERMQAPTEPEPEADPDPDPEPEAA